RYAISTDFRDFAPFDEESKLFFLAEFKHRGRQSGFEDATKGFGVQIGPANDDTPYSTLRANKQAVLDPKAFAGWNDHVKRVELSLPLKPSSPAPFFRTD